MSISEVVLPNPAILATSLPSIKERQRQLREDAILERAHQIMATQGYKAMTMDDLASGLGISTGTLYQHFASKEELALGVASRSARIQKQFLADLDTSLPALSRLETFLRWRIAEKFRDEWPDVEAIIYVVRSQSKRRPALQEQLEQAHLAISQLVDTAKNEGDIRPDIATPVLTELLKTSVSQATLDSGRYSIEELTDSLVKILLDRVRSEK